MSPETQKRIASLGGKAAHARGTAHEFSSEEAREAGKLGGIAAQKSRANKKSKEAIKAFEKGKDFKNLGKKDNVIDGASMEDVT